MTAEEIRKLKYVGGGYFRVPGPIGTTMPIYRAPEVVEALLKLLEVK